MICDNEQPNYDVEYGWSNYLGMYILHKRYVDVKFIYSEKATKFCEISTVDLTVSA